MRSETHHSNIRKSDIRVSYLEALVLICLLYALDFDQPSFIAFSVI